MGFFSDLKEDLSQAVNELMPEDEKNKADEPAEMDESGVSLDEMLKNIDDFQLPEDAAEPEAQETAEESAVQEENGTTEPEFNAEPETYGTPEPEMYNESAVYGGSENYDGLAYGEQAVPEEPVTDAESGAEDAEMEELLAQMLAEGVDGQPEAQEEAVQYEPLQDEPMLDESMQNEAMVDEVMMSEAMQDEAMMDEVMMNEAVQDETIMEESKGEEEEMDMEEMELVRDLEVSDETSVITEGMTITGDMSTQGSIDVIGTVNGNIDALGKLNITGHVNGNSKAAEIYAESAKINGEIVSEGAVKIGASSVIIGNITATSAAIAGAVKGDIDVRGPVILDASAIVMGNIKSKSVQINNGAVIEGMCSQCYADVSPTTFFDEYKPEGARKSKAKQNEQREK